MKRQIVTAKFPTAECRDRRALKVLGSVVLAALARLIAWANALDNRSAYWVLIQPRARDPPP